jgi:DNA-dependent protein kinase catalytic subunit
VTLRSEFAKSLAVSSLFGYLLGLGDRHLENLLLDSQTGAVVQIDFGVCFGIGSSLLPVPELIPFRLTPQLQGVLQPLEGAGLLRHYMVQAMTTLRAEEVSVE